MQAFTKVVGPAAPLLRQNVDTDVIIRIERLTELKPANLGRHAFEVLRYRPDGSENPDFILNQPAFRNAPILIAGRNFGCGSSREAAVWALMGIGLRAVLAESFGDIFFSNCFQNGMLPVVLPGATIERLAQAAAGGASVEVDLVRNVVVAPDGEVIPFEVDPQRREALLEGLDEIGRTIKRNAEIDAWQQRDRAARPWVWELA
jgi:3-isopropylmalate/(R)-2-methylmalate dehydratase small subunit